TLTPSIVTHNDKGTLAVSVAGGDLQDQASLQLIINHIDFELSPGDSVEALRFATDHHLGSFRQTPPDLGSLKIPFEIGESTLNELAAKGHRLKKSGPLGTPVVIHVNQTTGAIEAAGDPKTGRHAAAY
ncbi:MAG: hypothetical protein FJ267_00955, partial [Planctomycetes bacterium]|nr:hypothetical protein [Planctomycetota bacterium]